MSGGIPNDSLICEILSAAEEIPEIMKKNDKRKSPVILEITGLSGARGETRTPDARFRKPTLYPLSYASMFLHVPYHIIIIRQGQQKNRIPKLQRKLRDLEAVYDVFSEEEKPAGMDEFDADRGLNRIRQRFIGYDRRH